MDETGRGVSLTQLLARIGGVTTAEAFRRAKHGLTKIAPTVRVELGADEVERSEPLSRVPALAEQFAVTMPANRTMFPALDIEVEGLSLERYENGIGGGFIPDLSDPHPTYHGRNYNPSFRSQKIPIALEIFLQNVAREAHSNGQNHIVDCVANLQKVSQKHVLTNGTIQGMFRRLNACQEVGRLIAARRAGPHKDWKPQKAGEWPTRDLLPEIRAHCETIFPLDDVTDPITDHQIAKYIIEQEAKGRATMKFNLKADAGMLLQTNNAVIKREETLAQDLRFAETLLDKLDGLTAQETKKYLEDNEWLLACKAKPKFEVAELEVVGNRTRVKKTRIIFVYSSAVTTPAQLIYSMASKGHQSPSLHNQSKSLYGFNPFDGGMHTLLIMAMLDCKLITKKKEVKVSREFPGYALYGYSDNLYNGTPIRREGQEPVLRWHSLDGAKMEAQITFGKYRLAAEYYASKLGPLTNGWANYLNVLLPLMAVRSTGIIGKHEIDLKIMGSGVPGTFSANQCAGLVALDYEVTTNYKPGAKAFWREAIVDGKFSEAFQHLMKRVGAEFTIESIVEIPIEAPPTKTFFRTDLLGFDAVSLGYLGVKRYAAVLARERLEKSYVFSHRPDKTDTESELVSFSALHRYVVLTTLYLIGGWAHDDLSKIMLLEAHQKLASIVNAGLVVDRESLIEILVNQADLNEDAITSMLPIVEKMRLPNALTAIARQGLTESQLEKARLKLIEIGEIMDTDTVEGSEVEQAGGRVQTIQELVFEREANLKNLASQTHLPKPRGALDTTVDKPNRTTRVGLTPGQFQSYKPKPVPPGGRAPMPEFIRNSTFDALHEHFSEMSLDEFGIDRALRAVRFDKTKPFTFNESAKFWARDASSRLDGVSVLEALHYLIEQGYRFFDRHGTVLVQDAEGGVTRVLGPEIHGKPPKAPAIKKAPRTQQEHLERFKSGGGLRLRDPAKRDEARRKGRDLQVRAARDAKGEG